MPCGLDCHDCIDPTPSIPGDYSIPGFGVQRNCRNAKWALLVRSVEPQADWVEYRPRRTPFEAVKPATAVRFEGKMWHSRPRL
jgi:hypothetical protein